MARKDKPYLPLYIQDFMTDEKLMECSASATGVYIRIMCVMHKSIKYGTILLKQKDKQKLKQIENFALKLDKHLPYDLSVIISGIEELVDEGCLTIDGDYLIQKRMLEDGELSEVRSKSGSNGGKKTQNKNNKNKKFAQAKTKANSDIDIDIESDTEDVNEFEEEGVGEDLKAQKKNSNNMSSIKDTEGIPLPFKSPEFALIWKEWLQHRKEARIKNYTPTGLRRLFKWISETSAGDEGVAIQIIEQSLTKGWQGLFELKTLPNAANFTNTSAGNKEGSVSKARIQAAKNF